MRCQVGTGKQAHRSNWKCSLVSHWLAALVMHFYSGPPMHLLSGVDSRGLKRWSTWRA